MVEGGAADPARLRGLDGADAFGRAPASGRGHELAASRPGLVLRSGVSPRVAALGCPHGRAQRRGKLSPATLGLSADARQRAGRRRRAGLRRVRRRTRWQGRAGRPRGRASPRRQLDARAVAAAAGRVGGGAGRLAGDQAGSAPAGRRHLRQVARARGRVLAVEPDRQRRHGDGGDRLGHDYARFGLDGASLRDVLDGRQVRARVAQAAPVPAPAVGLAGRRRTRCWPGCA